MKFDISKLENIQPVSISRIVGPHDAGEHVSIGFWTTPGVPFRNVNMLRSSFTMLYLLDGSGEFIDEFNISHPVRPGSLILRIHNVVHGIIRARSPQWVEFSVTLPRSISNAIQILGIIGKKHQIQDIGIDSVISDRLIETITRLGKTPYTDIELIAACLSMSSELICRSGKNKKADNISNKIEQAARLIEDDMSEQINMDVIAEKSGMGYEHFRKAFKDQMGISPKNFRIRRRMETARRLLSSTTLTIKEISIMLGYSDIGSFTRQFSRLNGGSPTKFRNRAN